MANIPVGTNLSSTFPHFFTVVLEPTLRTNKLQIPKKIAKKCGNGLTDEVLIKLPCGKEWKLGLTKSSEDRKVWIDKGWSEFSKYYSIAWGHLLVFRYQMNSQFQVLIFDKTMVEIDYLGIIMNNQAQPETIDVENLDNVPIPSPKTREKSPFSCSRRSKRMRTKSCPQTYQFHDPNPIQENNASGSKLGPKKSNTTTSRFHKPLTGKIKANPIKMAGNFQSESPSFTVIMSASYTSGKCNFHIPVDFAKMHIASKKIKASLRVSADRSWSALYKVRNSKPELCDGWREFSRENDLKKGDICTFKLTNSDEVLVFQVSIVKAAREGRENPPLAKSKVVKSEPNTNGEVTRTSKASEAADKFLSSNPNFQVDFPISHLYKDRLNLPLPFARRYLEKKSQDVTLEVGERCWTVKLCTYPTKYCLSCGWSVFVTESSLHPGDIGIFELIQRDPAVFKVFIFSNHKD